MKEVKVESRRPKEDEEVKKFLEGIKERMYVNGSSMSEKYEFDFERELPMEGVEVDKSRECIECRECTESTSGESSSGEESMGDPESKPYNNNNIPFLPQKRSQPPRFRWVRSKNSRFKK